MSPGSVPCAISGPRASVAPSLGNVYHRPMSGQFVTCGMDLEGVKAGSNEKAHLLGMSCVPGPMLSFAEIL